MEMYTPGVKLEEYSITVESLAELNTLETEIKADFSKVITQINQDKGIELVTRPDGFHLTIIGPTESKVFNDMTSEQLGVLRDINKKIQKGEGVIMEGIGFIDGANGDNIKAADKEKKVCFLAVSIPELQAFRASLGLPEKNFHVTLGFIVGDIHMEIAGKNDKGKDVLKSIAKKADPAMDEYMSLLEQDALKFGPLDGQKKELKQEKLKNPEKIVSYDPVLIRLNLEALSTDIKVVLNVEKIIELAVLGKIEELNAEIKKSSPLLKANMKFVKEALQKSEK